MLIIEITQQGLRGLQRYAREVVSGGGIDAVYLIGSAVSRDDPGDIDLLYVLDLPATADEEDIVQHVETTQIDLDGYDSFFRVGNRFYHLSSGAGRDIVPNDSYAAEQAGKPKLLLAQR